MWIDGAPTVGKEEPEEVLRWILERITCHIPEEASNLELHQLVTKYQYHKSSGYCQRKKKNEEHVHNLLMSTSNE